MVFFKCAKSFLQRRSNTRDVFEFFRRQAVDVFVQRLTRINFVLDAVQTCHQQRGEKPGSRLQEGSGVRYSTRLASRPRLVHRDTQGSGTVTVGVSQVNRSFKTRNQTLVGVGAGVGECTQSLGVLHDTTDVVHGHFGQTAVAVAGKLG